MGNLWNRVIKTIKDGDTVMEIVDARAPFATRSHKLENLIEKLGKNLVIVINKSDLVPEKYVKYSHQKIIETAPCIFVSSRKRRGMLQIRKMINMHRPKGEKDVKVSIVGYPNTGKSSIINLLAGRHAAGVAPIPGHTRGEQWIRISSHVMLFDTPGIIPSEEEFSIIKGLCRPEKMKNVDDSIDTFIKRISDSKYNNLKEIYNISDADIKNGRTLEIIAKARGCLVKGGRPDLQRVARTVISDWNSGKIQAFIG
ncbi:MAG: GTPase [archaeon]|nr:GTPase [archaeon]